MQSRVAATARRSPLVLSLAHNQALRRGLASSSAGRTADPDIHSGEVEASPDVYNRKNDGQGTAVGADDTVKQETEHKPSTETGPLKPPRTPYASSPRLESTGGLNPPPDPIMQQKRSHGTTTISLEEVSCAGLDGRPWPKDKEEEQRDEREGQVEDYRDYYKHHKASPLSEMKMVDTRKPITRATDGTADADEDYGHGSDVIVWRPEQLDTAEEALMRAVEIFRQNAMRGDPDLPHSRVLRELRGEWF
ncbi:uncharacterized protein LOC132171665 [Corylus avellana]|uniref:uncharacterized protein LOC132171665 n=1 Tax=Corylus avellana TaxID=13451 RepID=UPI00286A0C7D|nr:uncharacterized protein LOC132171665 [Corylus avellana]